MISLIYKEIRELFSSSLLAIAILAYAGLSFLFLWVFPETSYFSYGYASTQLYFEFGYLLMIVFIPALSVALFAGEFRHGTIETLNALPLTWHTVLLSKYVAGIIMIVLLALVTIPNYFILKEISTPVYSEGAVLIGSYTGFLLIGLCLLAASLSTTILFEGSAAAFMIAVLVNFLLFYGFIYLSDIPLWSNDMSFTLQKFSVKYHADYLSKGVIALSSLCYLITVAGIFYLLGITGLRSKQY